MKKDDEYDLALEDEMPLKLIATSEKNNIPDLKDFEQYFEPDKADDKNLKKLISPKQKNKYRLIPLVAIISLLFVGSGFHVWNVLIKDNQTYSEIIKQYDYQEVEESFVLLPEHIPDQYMISHVNDSQGYSEVIFENQNDETCKIIFSESETVFSFGIDTEDTTPKNVTLDSGISGIYIDKNGMQILVWEQNGFFYRLVCTDKSISKKQIIKIASVLINT